MRKFRCYSVKSTRCKIERSTLRSTLRALARPQCGPANTASAAASLFPTSPATGVTGSVLVRLVNAGLRMHVPSIVGTQTGTPTARSGFSLIAEDGNPLPGVARVQSEVFMAAGKTYDVMVNVPAAGGTAIPVF